MNVPVIDASVHIFSQSNKDLRQNLHAGAVPQPRLPRLRDGLVRRPRRRVRRRTPRGPNGQYPGSDPEVVAKHLFTDRGVDIAILHPMTRGIMPDRHLGTAIAPPTTR